MPFGLVLAAVAVVAGGVAAVTGFGIGSLLTPTLALETGTKLAVAAIAIPHLVGTAQRFWMLRHHVDRPYSGASGSPALSVVWPVRSFTPGLRAAR